MELGDFSTSYVVQQLADQLLSLERHDDHSKAQTRAMVFQSTAITNLNQRLHHLQALAPDTDVGTSLEQAEAAIGRICQDDQGNESCVRGVQAQFATIKGLAVKALLCEANQHSVTQASPNDSDGSSQPDAALQALLREHEVKIAVLEERLVMKEEQWQAERAELEAFTNAVQQTSPDRGHGTRPQTPTSVPVTPRRPPPLSGILSPVFGTPSRGAQASVAPSSPLIASPLNMSGWAAAWDSNQRVISAQQTASNMNQLADELQTSLHRANAALAEANMRISELEALLAEANGKLREFEQVAEQDKDSEYFQSVLATKNAEIAELQSAKADSKDRVTTLLDHIGTLEKKIQSLCDSNSKVEELQRLLDEANEREAQSAESSIKTTENMTQLMERISDLERQIEQAAGNSRNLTKRYSWIAENASMIASPGPGGVGDISAIQEVEEDTVELRKLRAELNESKLLNGTLEWTVKELRQALQVTADEATEYHKLVASGLRRRSRSLSGIDDMRRLSLGDDTPLSPNNFNIVSNSSTHDVAWITESQSALPSSPAGLHSSRRQPGRSNSPAMMSGLYRQPHTAQSPREEVFQTSPTDGPVAMSSPSLPSDNFGPVATSSPAADNHALQGPSPATTPAAFKAPRAAGHIEGAVLHAAFESPDGLAQARRRLKPVSPESSFITTDEEDPDRRLYAMEHSIEDQGRELMDNCSQLAGNLEQLQGALLRAELKSPSSRQQPQQELHVQQQDDDSAALRLELEERTLEVQSLTSEVQALKDRVATLQKDLASKVHDASMLPLGVSASGLKSPDDSSQPDQLVQPTPESLDSNAALLAVSEELKVSREEVCRLKDEVASQQQMASSVPQSELELKLEEAQSHAAEKDLRITALSLEVQTLSDSVTASANQLEAAQAQVDVLNSQLLADSEARQVLSQQLDVAQSQIDLLNSQLLAEAEDRQALSQQLEAAHAQVDRLKPELLAGSEERQDLSQQLEAAQAQVELLTSQLLTSSEERQSTEKDLAEALETAGSCATTEQELKAKLEVAQSSLEKVTSQLATAERNLEEVKASAASADARSTQHLQELSAELSASQNEVVRLQKAEFEAMDALKQAQSTLELQIADHATADAELGELQVKFQSLSNELELANLEVNRLQQTAASATQELEAIQKTDDSILPREELEEQLAVTVEQLKRSKSEVAHLIEEQSSSQAEVERVKQQLSDAQAANARLTKDVSKWETAAKQAKDKLQKEHVELQTAQSRLKDARKAAADGRGKEEEQCKKIKTLEKRLAVLEEQLRASKTSLVTANASVIQARADLEANKAELATLRRSVPPATPEIDLTHGAKGTRPAPIGVESDLEDTKLIRSLDGGHAALKHRGAASRGESQLELITVTSIACQTDMPKRRVGAAGWCSRLLLWLCGICVLMWLLFLTWDNACRSYERGSCNLGVWALALERACGRHGAFT